MKHELNLIEGIDLQHSHESIIDAMADGLYIVDRDRRIRCWNPAAERLTGYPAEQVLGARCSDGLLKHCSAKGDCLCGNGCPLKHTMEDGQSRDAHVFLHHAEGHRAPVHVRSAPLRDGDGHILGAVEIFNDDTDRVNTLERIRGLEEEALVDELTGLANRRYFQRSLNSSIAQHERHGTPFGVLLMDIDHFKHFNDTYGHLVGDSVLRMVAKTIANSCRNYDIPARWGGEEFAVLTARCDVDFISHIGERIRTLVESAWLTEAGHDLSVTVSVGAALFDRDSSSQAITQRADEALYASKQGGRNRVTLAT